MARTKERKIDPQASLTMQLPQWDADTKNHILISADGTLEAGIEIHLPSTTLAGQAGQMQVHQGFIDALKHALPEGERARVYIEIGPIGEEMIAAYEDSYESSDAFVRELHTAKAEGLRSQRRELGLVSYRCFVLFSSSRPDSLLDRFMSKVRKAYEKNVYESQVARLDSTRKRLFQTFLRMGVNPKLLSGQDLFALAWRYFNPHERMMTPPQFVHTKAHFGRKLLEKHPSAADRTLRSQLTRSPVRRYFEYLRSTNYFTGMVSMEGLPVGETFTGMANQLMFLPGTYWLVIDLHHNRQGPSLRQLHGHARKMVAAANDTTVSDMPDPESRVGAGDADAALMHITRTGSHLFQVGMSLVLQARTHDQLQSTVERAIDTLTRMKGVGYTHETFGLFRQYLNLSPGSGVSNDRMFQTLEENATAFLPTSAPWEGNHDKPVALFQNRWGSLTGIDPFDPKSSNWNGIVVGGSGSGKTFMMQMYANELRGQDADLIIIDRGGGYRHLLDLHGGHMIPLAPGEVSINPFDLPGDEFAPSAEKRSFLLSLIKTMIRTSGADVTGATDTIIGAAIDQTYDRSTREMRDEFGHVRTVFDGCRLSDLVQVLLRLEVVGDRTATHEDRNYAQKLATILQAWTGDNPLGRFIDRETNIDTSSPVLCYETSGLMSNPQLAPVGIMMIANLVWERCERDKTKRKLIVFDEVWSLLKIPEAAAFIVELYRRLRRYGAAAYTVTQSLEDFMTPEARGILQSTTHFYLLKLQGEDAFVQDFFGLNPDSMAAFKSLTSVRGEYSEALAWIARQNDVEGGIVRVTPHPLEYWAFTTNAQDMALREQTLEKNQGNLLKTLMELAEHHPKGT